MKPGPEVGFKGTEEDRFWSKVILNPVTGCWEWQAGCANGYGVFYLQGTREQIKAHRWAYEFCIGPIPIGLEPDHTCRNTICVNPWHLEPVTHAVNLARGESPLAKNGRKTHCKNGHPFNFENTIFRDGKRRCRICRDNYNRSYKQAHHG